jgi:LmbE family N-acetylglucosaminyl deacetylase
MDGRGVKRWLRDFATLERVRRRFRRTVGFVTTPHVRELVPDPTWRALVLAPHPDDEAIWCGGLVRRVVEAGGAVDCVFLTDGVANPVDDAALAEQRAAEGQASCRVLGVREVERYRLPEGDLRSQLRASERLAKRLKASAYSHVVCPWPYDWHEDHVATYRLLERAVRGLPRGTQAILFEAWGTLEPNAAIGIDSVLEAKKRAIAAHRSQIDSQDFVSLGIALSRFRSTCVPGATHAEAFFVTPVERLRRLS